MSAGRIIALVTAAAFVALVAVSLTGGQKPKPCESTLQEDVLNCAFTLGDKK